MKIHYNRLSAGPCQAHQRHVTLNNLKGDRKNYLDMQILLSLAIVSEARPTLPCLFLLFGDWNG